MKIEEVIQHHLVQNQGQKLTAHLIYGLVNMISLNIRNEGLSVDSDKNQELMKTVTEDKSND